MGGIIRCGIKEDVVTNIEKSMLVGFGHVERMSESRPTKGRREWQCWEGTLLVRFIRKVRCVVLATYVRHTRIRTSSDV